LVLTFADQRLFDEENGEMEFIPLGIMLIRGENVALVAEIDEILDGHIDWNSTFQGGVGNLPVFTY
jgi:hypothetical protein